MRLLMLAAAVSAASLFAGASDFALAQGQGYVPPGGPRTADARPAPPPRQPLQPSWWPLPERHQTELAAILNYWEYRSSTIERYQCKFKRWEYDPVFGPRDRSKARTVADGVIKYAAPDKGLFKVETLLQYKPPAEGAPPDAREYEPAENPQYDHWVCDGTSVFQFDYRSKQLIVRELPPEVRGKAIADGPLPFMFGAEAKKIESRFWLRIITPPKAAEAGKYWLEAWPKHEGDARAYQKLWVILDDTFLPEAILVYAVNYDERTHPAHTVFSFKDREVNVREGLFARAFYEPSLPASDWKRVVQQADAPDADTGQAAPPRAGPPRFPR